MSTQVTNKQNTFYGNREVGSNRSATDGGQYQTELLKMINADQVTGMPNNLSELNDPFDPNAEKRFYSGTGVSSDMQFSNTKADMDIMSTMLSNPSDSISYQNAISQFPDANVWGTKPGYEEEFFNQYGYYPKDMPKDADGYDIGHKEYMNQLNPPEEGKINLFNLLKNKFGK